MRNIIKALLDISIMAYVKQIELETLNKVNGKPYTKNIQKINILVGVAFAEIERSKTDEEIERILNKYCEEFIKI